MPFRNLHISKELALLLLLSKNKSQPVKDQEVLHLTSGNFNWHVFEAQAIRNRVAALIYQQLKNFSEAVPIQHLARFKHYSVLTGRRALVTLKLQNSLLSLLQANGIVALPFKGPILSERAYGDSGLRPSSDIDILIDKENVATASNLFKNNGVLEPLGLNNSQLKRFIQSEDHLAFRVEKNGITIELHWEMSGLYLPFPLTLKKIKKYVIKAPNNRITLLDLAPEFLIVYLSIHGAKHHCEYLEEVCCLTAIIQQESINWSVVETLATQLRCRRILFIGLYLTLRLYNAPIPYSIIAKINDDIRIRRLADKVLNGMFSSMTKENEKQIRRFSDFHFRNRDSHIDALRYALRLIFRPTDKEWLHLPVSTPFLVFYPLLRPFRLIVSGLKAIFINKDEIIACLKNRLLS